MTLLIDPPNAPGHGRLWSHLVSDRSYDELHRFAETFGIPRRGFDRDHYDIPQERYEAVLAAGAEPVSSREIVTRLTAAGLRRRKGEVLAPRAPGRSLVRAPRLVAGDTVAVVAPSGPVPVARLEAGLEVVSSWGLQVVVGAHVRATHPHLAHLAGADRDRADDLAGAWCDPRVRAVLCARGGYGAQRIVDLLDWDALAAAGPKVLVGFSDVTALHQAFGARLGLSTLHGPVATSLGAGDEASRDHLRRMLLAPEAGTSLAPDPLRALVPGIAEGVLVGGNLSLLAAGLATGVPHPGRSSIVVLEDVGEPPYRLDRALTQLLRSGWFAGVRGVVVGDLTRCGEPEALRALLADRLGPLAVPVAVGAAFGHERRNLAFPLGVPARLDADAGTLHLRAPALR